jgi:hypothetical protein
MASGSATLRVYEELADWYERQSQAQMRDRFLLLAADTAMAAGQPDEAERLRLRLLQHSPHHMLRPFASFGEAMTSPDVQGYISDLRQTYPPETAEQLLESLQANGAAEPPLPPAAPPEPARQAPARPAEPLKVYRVKDEEARPAPAPPPPPPRPAPRPAPPANVPLPPLAEFPAPPPAPPAPRPAPAPIPLARPPAPPRAEAPRPYRGPLAPVAAPRHEPEEPAEASGGWVAVGLFGLVLLVAAALAVYTFARPFLPPGWLP